MAGPTISPRWGQLRPRPPATPSTASSSTSPRRVIPRPRPSSSATGSPSRCTRGAPASGPSPKPATSAGPGPARLRGIDKPDDIDQYTRRPHRRRHRRAAGRAGQQTATSSATTGAPLRLWDSPASGRTGCRRRSAPACPTARGDSSRPRIQGSLGRQLLLHPLLPGGRPGRGANWKRTRASNDAVLPLRARPVTASPMREPPDPIPAAGATACSMRCVAPGPGLPATSSPAWLTPQDVDVYVARSSNAVASSGR